MHPADAELGLVCWFLKLASARTSRLSLAASCASCRRAVRPRLVVIRRCGHTRALPAGVALLCMSGHPGGRVWLRSQTRLAATCPRSPTGSCPTCVQVRCIHGLTMQLRSSTIAQTLDGLTSGAFTSFDLVSAYLSRIAEVNHLRAVLETNHRALEQAAQSDARRRTGGSIGALEGVPILLKDAIGTERLTDADMQTTAGSYALLDSYPSGDSDVASRLKAAGAIIIGKANQSQYNICGSRVPSQRLQHRQQRHGDDDRICPRRHCKRRIPRPPVPWRIEQWLRRRYERRSRRCGDRDRH